MRPNTRRNFRTRHGQCEVVDVLNNRTAARTRVDFLKGQSLVDKGVKGQRETSKIRGNSYWSLEATIGEGRKLLVVRSEVVERPAEGLTCLFDEFLESWSRVMIGVAES